MIERGVNMQERFLFCPVCGGHLNTEFVSGTSRRVCSICKRVNYENPIVGVAGIVLNENGEILLGKRAATVDHGGMWCIPCGYVEYDEDVRAAVVREIFEETGLQVRCRELFDVHSNFHNPVQHTVGIWFICEVLSGTPEAGDDIIELKWYLPINPPPMAFTTDCLVLGKLCKERNEK